MRREPFRQVRRDHVRVEFVALLEVAVDQVAQPGKGCVVLRKEVEDPLVGFCRFLELALVEQIACLLELCLPHAGHLCVRDPVLDLHAVFLFEKFPDRASAHTGFRCPGRGGIPHEYIHEMLVGAGGPFCLPVPGPLVEFTPQQKLYDASLVPAFAVQLRRLFLHDRAHQVAALCHRA